MALKFAITDLYGEQLAVPQQYAAAVVTIPYNDSRTAQLTLSAEDPAVVHALPLERMLKAYYVWPDGTANLVFWGPIVTPTWSLQLGQASTVQIQAMDMSLRLKNHYLGSDDVPGIFASGSADGTVAIAYSGLYQLRDAGKNVASENADGIPGLWLPNGTNTHPGPFASAVLTANFAAGDTVLHVDSTLGLPSATGSGESVDVAGHLLTYTAETANTLAHVRDGGATYAGPTIPAGTHLFYSVARALAVQHGDNVWDRWIQIASDEFGPDFRLRPVEGVVDAYAYLDTFDKRETTGGARDKRDAVIFQAGFGIENVEAFTYAPAGDQVKNRAVAVQPNQDPNQADKVYVARNLTSAQRYGRYEWWQAAQSQADATGPVPSLKLIAQGELVAYSYPPQMFSLTPRADETQRFIFGRDYEEGEVISCGAHFGGLRIRLAGFITEVRLRQRNALGSTATEIDTVPEIGTTTEIA